MLVLWYGLSASIFSFWLWMKGIRHVPGSRAGVFSAVLPVAAACRRSHRNSGVAGAARRKAADSTDAVQWRA
ncbi:hypothetical protein SAMN05445850_2688 [Paraburkholderia tuberum]|uniref:Uncharacterized protein n=1 Tax=Paraburkholderia tuberum TaxID=157910 RepID=A0A1H1G3M2_9BURK|nr:hypothetical protein SAMN05445850_2688 [Paraburkholderia tuberum]